MDDLNQSGEPGMNGGEPENAWGFLPEGLGSLKDGFESPQAFWAEMGNLNAMAKERAAITGTNPESLVNEEDWKNFWRKAGTPDDPDGYKLPESFNGENIDPAISAQVNEILGQDKQAIMQAFHACNLTNKQAEALYGVIGGIMAENIANDAASQPDPGKVVSEVWPQDTDKHLDVARRGAKHAGLGDELDKAGLSANPLVLKLAHALGEITGESSAPGQGGGVYLPSGQSAKEEMYRLISSEAYKNNDPAAIRKVQELAARANLK